jgi:hypothetical protein
VAWVEEYPHPGDAGRRARGLQQCAGAEQCRPDAHVLQRGAS